MTEYDVRILINGDDKDVREGATVAELIKDLDLKPERVAIELNRKILSRSEWPRAGLADGDKLEIVHFVGGGMPSAPGDYLLYAGSR